ncbi:MAG TPA: universal stress protein [Acidimicrobiia bacterium]|nr:universal stress protein [Acidimicrobiia bacterium]
MTRTLAFGDDHSAQAEVCWSWITAQRWDGWSLEVVTAEPRADLRPMGPDEAELRPWEPDSPREIGNSGFDSLVHLRAEIDPRVALIAKPWDLVAIGPRGSGLLKRLHLGSTADWLLREPTSPLVIANESGQVRDVLFAADGSSHSARALDCVVSLPWVTDVRVIVLVVDDGRVDVESAARSAEKPLADAGVETVRMVRSGRPAHEILDECHKTSPDLVVMGVRGHDGIKELVVGSTTTAVAGSITTSILVAHAEIGQEG